MTITRMIIEDMAAMSALEVHIWKLWQIYSKDPQSEALASLYRRLQTELHAARVDLFLFGIQEKVGG